MANIMWLYHKGQRPAQWWHIELSMSEQQMAKDQSLADFERKAMMGQPSSCECYIHSDLWVASQQPEFYSRQPVTDNMSWELTTRTVFGDLV